MHTNTRRALVVAALTAAMLPVVVNAVGSTPAAHTAPVSVASLPVATVHGSYAASSFWKQQGASDCAPSSVRVVVGVVNGKAPSLKAIDAVAARVAGYDDNGTQFELLPNVFAAYGIAARAGSTTLDNIRASLDNGHPVIADIDANPIWALSGLHGAADGPAAHAVVIERIDDTAHTVTLVDSGFAGGMTETVPTAIFMTAWDWSLNSVVMVGLPA